MPNSCSITPAVLKIGPLLLLLAILAMPAAAQNGVLLGTLPFTLRFDVGLSNPSPWFRRLSGRMDVDLAEGGYFSNWRRGYTSTSPFEQVTLTWTQHIPALPAVVGGNTFHLLGADTTPAPYNQPPYPAAGDTASALCTVTGVAP
jgi:hypothetical protein